MCHLLKCIINKKNNKILLYCGQLSIYNIKVTTYTIKNCRKNNIIITNKNLKYS